MSFSSLAGAARLPLGTWPTPVRPVFELREGLYLKDDGACSPIYGGNKVRKLEFLLAVAGESIVTVGAYGSHHVLATALHARALGKRVHAVLLPRPPSAWADRVNEATAAVATLERCADGLAAGERLRELAHEGTFIPAGGSNAIGALGWVAAGHELAAQVRAGELPEPRRIYLPLGTAATAAGLATGLREAGLGSRVIGVRVVPLFVTPEARVAELGGPVEIDDGWLGEGYGHPTHAAVEAVERAARVGLALETTYTGKTLACALAVSPNKQGPDLWWNTLSTVPLPDPTRRGR